MNDNYIVEVSVNGCSSCHCGRTYAVLDSSGEQVGNSFEEEGDAENFATELDIAFTRGLTDNEKYIGAILDAWEQVPNDLQTDPYYEKLHLAIKELARNLT